MRPPEPQASILRHRHGRYAGMLALLALLALSLNTLLGGQSGVAGVAAGRPLPPFAVPLALAPLEGDANIATRSHDGQAGAKPACSVRGSEILNICQLYEQGPVVLALFVDGGDCPAILQDLKALAPSFPQVRFAAVAIKGERAALRKLVRARRLPFPVGYDRDGVLAGLYKLTSCPQLTFAGRGGTVQGTTLLERPPLRQLRERVDRLVAVGGTRQRRPAR